MRRDECLATIVTTAAFVIGVVIAPVAALQQQQPPKGQQPAVASGSKAATVDLDELESNPEKFLGKTVTVEGEVDTVLGPHLFTIDEKNWADPEREMPVFVAEPFAAMVRADAPVRVTGTVEKLPIARIDREPGLLGAPKVKAEIEAKPVLVASEVTTIAPTVVSLRTRTDTPAGTSGSGAGAIMTDAGEIAGSKGQEPGGPACRLEQCACQRRH